MKIGAMAIMLVALTAGAVTATPKVEPVAPVYGPYTRIMQFTAPLTVGCGQQVVIPLALHYPQPGEGKYRLKVQANGMGEWALWDNLGPINYKPICFSMPCEVTHYVTLHSTPDRLSVVLRGASLPPCEPTIWDGELTVSP